MLLLIVVKLPRRVTDDYHRFGGMMEDKTDKLKLLEHALMTLSMQVSGLQSKLKESSSIKEDYLKTMEGLRNLLDEKGIVTKQDFDSEVELFQTLKEINTEAVTETDLPPQKRKNSVH